MEDRSPLHMNYLRMGLLFLNFNNQGLTNVLLSIRITVN